MPPITTLSRSIKKPQPITKKSTQTIYLANKKTSRNKNKKHQNDMIFEQLNYVFQDVQCLFSKDDTQKTENNTTATAADAALIDEDITLPEEDLLLFDSENSNRTSIGLESSETFLESKEKKGILSMSEKQALYEKTENDLGDAMSLLASL